MLGGRWALFAPTTILTWDLAWFACWLRQAKMFTPLNEAEWETMKTKAGEFNPATGNFFMPIDDKGGSLVWNNGSCKYGLD